VTLEEGKRYRIHLGSGNFYGIADSFFSEPTFDFKMKNPGDNKELMISALISPYAYR